MRQNVNKHSNFKYVFAIWVVVTQLPHGLKSMFFTIYSVLLVPPPLEEIVKTIDFSPGFPPTFFKLIDAEYCFLTFMPKNRQIYIISAKFVVRNVLW